MKPFEPIIKEDLNFEFPYNIFGLEYFCIRKPFYSGNVYFGCYVDEDERSPTTYAGSKDEDFMGIWSGHLRATEKKYKTGIFGWGTPHRWIDEISLAGTKATYHSQLVNHGTIDSMSGVSPGQTIDAPIGYALMDLFVAGERSETIYPSFAKLSLSCGTGMYEEEGLCWCDTGSYMLPSNVCVYEKTLTQNICQQKCEDCPDGYICDKNKKKPCEVGYMCFNDENDELPYTIKKKCDLGFTSLPVSSECPIRLENGCALAIVEGKPQGTINNCKECFENQDGYPVLESDNSCYCRRGSFYNRKVTLLDNRELSPHGVSYSVCLTCTQDQYPDSLGGCKPIELVMVPTADSNIFMLDVTLPEIDLNDIDYMTFQFFVSKGGDEGRTKPDVNKKAKFTLSKSASYQVLEDYYLSPDVTPLKENEGNSSNQVIRLKGSNLELAGASTYWLRLFYDDIGKKKSDQWARLVYAKNCSCDGSRNDAPTFGNESLGEKRIFFDKVNLRICPRWIDNSHCDEKYSISKRPVNSKNENFENLGTYISDVTNCRYVESTVCDEVYVNAYPVGTQIQYKIEINHLTLPQLVSAFEPDQLPIYTTFTVPWVAKLRIRGLVADSSTQLPFSQYSVSILINGRKFADVDVTDQSGTASVSLTTESFYEINEVVVLPSKKVNNFEHQLLCLPSSDATKSALECAGVTFKVSHLSEETVIIKDMSVASVQGQITFKNTGNIPCPDANVTVCLIKSSNSEKTCKITDERGFYIFQAYYEEEYTVYVDSEEKIYQTNSKELGNGVKQHLQNKYDRWVFSVDGKLEYLNFVNTKTNVLKINFYGGECKIPLLGAIFTITTPSCDFTTNAKIEADTLFTSLKLPPMRYTIIIERNEDPTVSPLDINDINEFFGPSRNRKEVDLRETEGQITFKYEGKVKTELTWRTSTGSRMSPENTCDNYGTVLESGKFYVASFTSKQFYPKGMICSKYNENVTAVINDFVGENGGYCFSSRKNSNITQGCTPDKFSKQNGISVLVVLAEKPNYFSPYKKFLNFQLVTEQRYYPIEIFSVVVKGVWVNSNDWRSMGLPRWQPLMVLHQPPGDSSFSTLETGFSVSNEFSMYTKKSTDSNSRNSVKISEESEGLFCGGAAAAMVCHKTKKKLSLNDIGFLQSSTMEDTSSSSDIKQAKFSYAISTSSYAGARGGGGDLFLVPNLRILIFESLRLNVEATPISEELSTCFIEVIPEYQWKFEDKETADAISLITEYDILNKEIPRLEKLKQDNMNQKLSGTFDADLDNTLSEAIEGWKKTVEMNEQNKIEALSRPLALNLKSAVLGLEYKLCFPEADMAYLELINKIPDDCNNKLDIVFQYQRSMACTKSDNKLCKSSSQDIFNTICGQPLDMTDCMEAEGEEDLDRRSVSVSGNGSRVRREGGVEEESLGIMNNLKSSSINRITFSGGGHSFTYKISEITRSSGTTSERTATKLQTNSIEAGELNLLFVKTVKEDTEDTTYLVEVMQDTVISKENSKFLSFTLSDSNIGDKFDVEVYEDPMFGTPVFVTVAGASKCPHEENTVVREKIFLRATQGQILNIENAMPDDIAVIQLEIVNENFNDVVTPVLSLESHTNPHNLRIDVNGKPLALGGQMYKLQPGGKQVVNLELKRGSEYVYENVQVSVRSQCEWELALGNGMFRPPLSSVIDISISYLEECVPVRWWGNLDDYQTFSLSKNPTLGLEDQEDALAVEIKNMGKTSFKELERLEKVFLEYRLVGEREWRIPSKKDLENTGNVLAYFYNKQLGIDNEETSSGISKLYWDTSSLLSGNYELRVQAQCQSSGNKNFDNTITSVIQGKIDRISPELLGKPTPSDNFFMLDGIIQFTFDEILNCELPYTMRATLTSSYESSEYSEIYYYDQSKAEAGMAKLNLYCKDNVVRIFPTALINLEALMGQLVKVELCDVEDLVGNKLEDCVTNEFLVGATEVDTVESEVTVKLQENSLAGKSFSQILHNFGAVVKNVTGTNKVKLELSSALDEEKTNNQTNASNSTNLLRELNLADEMRIRVLFYSKNSGPTSSGYSVDVSKDFPNDNTAEQASPLRSIHALNQFMVKPKLSSASEEVSGELNYWRNSIKAEPLVPTITKSKERVPNKKYTPWDRPPKALWIALLVTLSVLVLSSLLSLIMSLFYYRSKIKRKVYLKLISDLLAHDEA